ncbi:MAG: PEP/pyruvate-binding domain-containing protein [Nitriliruptorales bacterium]|nr:PEP/pyruvate-binding domain-containing protein [Nitriliruptorales bacterium]
MKTINLTMLTLDDELDAAAAGGTAATLARLRAAGFPVPAGVVLDASTTAAIPGDADLAVRVADAVREQLGEGPMAVRSSAIAEDKADSSFAGQYETILDVTGSEALVDAIQRCAASGQAERVTSYATAAGAETASSIPVLVMPLVRASAAGVAFSADPVTGDDHVVVSAVSGLGDQLVDGSVTPDEWVVAANGQAERRMSVDTRLDGLDVRAVADLAIRVAGQEGHPVDIEWAVDPEGSLVLLQARPITALPVPPDIEWEPGLWQKDRVHYPQLMTPFGASTFLPTISDAMGKMAAEWGMVLDRIDQKSVGGEIYGRIVPVGVDPSKTARPAPPAIVMGILSRLVPAMRARMQTARRRLESGDLERLPDRWRDDWRPEMEAALERALAVDLNTLDAAGLVRELDAAVGVLQRGQYIHFQLFVAHVVGLAEFVTACEAQLEMDALEAVTVLQGSSAASSEPAAAMAALAERARRSPDVMRVLEDPDDDLVARIGSADPDLGVDVESWVRAYGWRTDNYDPGAMALAEQPTTIAALLRSSEVGTSPDDEDRVHAFRSRLEGLDADRRARLEQLLDTALATYGLREENSLFCDGLAAGSIRRVLAAIGRRLAEQGVLASANDASMLTIDEIRSALGQAGGDDLRPVVRRRRAEQAWVAAHPGPDFVGGEPSDPPDVRFLPPAGRRLSGAFMFMVGHEYGARELHEGPELRGLGACAGTHRGRVRIVRGDQDFHRLQPGEVMVCPITTPVWSPLFAVAGALVTDHGGVLSHASIVARENGLPAVVGTGRATEMLQDGMEVTVDGSTGVVTVH